MAKICFINGSPRGKNSASKTFIDELCKITSNTIKETNYFSLNDQLDYGKVVDSDAIVIAFPLYVDTLPSSVIEFLEALELFSKNITKQPKIYAIVNCGFFEGIQTKNAMALFENFCLKTGFIWRFGVGIGAGEFMKLTKDIIPINSDIKREVYNAFIELNEDIVNNKHDFKESLFISPNFPKSEFIASADNGWVEFAKTFSVSKEQLYSTPLKNTL
ncbi:flavodoxin [Clostridium folliculivorans]|uniref:Flavodoxin n=1 Tax=Clostridium folliculivorans TaxID=2886038 RepID=A0A9W6DCI5_9CLOT|nr:flavodoxin [Clostridium folliculivorans]GKU27046.1 hypothetical protein CFOLD11_38730 [Clostridium folliculivorans]GKU29112.1 hypothetical protein CFB3_12180 [Clostridium folliculivorans]